MHFESKPRQVTPQIDRLGKTNTVLGISTHIYGVCKEKDGKTFILKEHLGMWPLKSIILEKRALFWGFQHTFMGFWGDRWENMHFESTPRHVTPQIKHHLGKTSTVLREGFNTHLWGFWEDRWENMHFVSTPRHVTPQIDHLGKTSTVLRVSTHIYGVFEEIDGKTCILRVHLGMWPLKSIILEKQALFWGFQHTFMGFLRR